MPSGETHLPKATALQQGTAPRVGPLRHLTQVQGPGAALEA